MKNIYTACILFCLPVFCCLSQTFPRPVPGGYDRVNKTDNLNYETEYRPCFTEHVTSDISFQGYDEAQPAKGLGEVTYYYRSINPRIPCPIGQQAISKPIVILDGFDPQDTRAGAEVYGKYLRYSINGTDEFLGNVVRTQGYDVVILNFPRYETGMRGGFTYTPIPGRPPITISGLPRVRDGGADYIERNAFVLIKLIRQSGR